MNAKRPLNNSALTGMLVLGGALTLIGFLLWIANAPTSTSAASPVGQFFGAGLGMFGIMLLSLGWAAAAICRQIADAAPREGVKR